MTRHARLPFTGTLGALTFCAPGFHSLADILGIIAHSVQVDAIQLGIDLGTGYRRDCYVAQAAAPGLLSGQPVPPFMVMRETRRRRCSTPPGLVAAPDWVDQHSLHVGIAGRRSAPRSGIALMRSPARPRFKPRERRELHRLLPHLNCAIALAWQLECVRQQEAYAVTMLEHAEAGILLLSPDGTPLHGTPRAFELLKQARIRVAQRLQLPTHALQNHFDAALACACTSAYPASTLIAPGPPPVVMTLRRIHAPSPSTDGSPLTLTLTLRGPRSVRLAECVAQHFGLTPAEFRLCAALVEGTTLKACAQRWERSYDTLRSQLKAIRAKTGTHRQAELIALLEAFTAP
jgi:DNA-binding CsgD family transcriptional regulator